MSNQLIIDSLLSQDESERLVFFKNLNTTIIAQHICALLNLKGGDILIGIDINKEVVGITTANIKDFTIDLKNNISPTAPFSMTVVEYKNKNLLLINVWPGGNKPYSYNGKIYIHIGLEARVASAENLVKLNEERKISEYHWERQSVLGAEIDDLDYNEIKETITAYSKDKPEFKGLETEEFLSRLGLLRGGNLTNAAIILFATNPTRFLPQCRMRITVYQKDKSTNTLLFDKLFEGNLFKNLSNAWDFFETYLKKSTRIEGLIRTEKGFPKLALREGLMNALVHRDYSLVSGNLSIEIFDDRLEITNSGELLNQLKIADLKKEHPSLLRNPDIAKVCFIRGYIEMLGTGTLRMINDCEINGFDEPIWISENKMTKLTFNGLTHQIINEGANEGANEGVKLNIEGVNEGVKRELIEIMGFLKENPVRRVPEIADHIKKGISTVERYLKILKDNDLIEFNGATKTGGYQLKK